MAVNLTQGAIVKMCFTSEDLHPVLQVIDLKLVQSQQNSSTERYRVILSDGLHYEQGMLATQKNELVHNGRLQKGSIVKLTLFTCNHVQTRKLLIVVDLEVIMDKCDLIGKPDPAPKEAPALSAASHAGNVQSAAGQLESTAEKAVMAVNLTQGAIMKMCFTSEEIQPVLQVIDLKLLQSQQNSTTKMYQLVLSDGSYYKQGTLSVQKNKLIHSGRLQKGSIVKLNEIICNDVNQNLKIIFFVELDVILDKWDLIGKPVPAPEEALAKSAAYVQLLNASLIGKPVTARKEATEPKFATKEDIEKQAEKIDQFIEISNKRHEDVLASQAHIRNTLAQILARLT